MKSKKSSFKKKHSKNEKKENEIQMTSKLFGDYVVYEKIEPEKEEEENKYVNNEKTKEETDPSTNFRNFGEWLIYMIDPENSEKNNISTNQPSKSRFSDFFNKIQKSKTEDKEEKSERDFSSLSTKSGTPDLLRTTFDDTQNFSDMKISIGSSVTSIEKDSRLSSSINSVNSINQMENLGDSNEKVMDLNLDINKVFSLEDKRTTIMIKNIPNKFNRDLLLNIINSNFRGTFDLFILPTDINKFKNFGYAFINFTNSYYIPYFYFMFNGKMWSRTNSQKVCELTYSKVQGKENLLAHYPSKIIYLNEEAKNVTPEQKYIIPNDYKLIFHKFFPNQVIEEYKHYFITKLPKQE